MLSGLKYRLGIVDVEVTPKHIVVEGISTFALFKDMYRIWGNNTISKYMFSTVRASELKMKHFFGLDFLYICETIYKDRQSRTPKRVLAKIIDALLTKTWLGQIDRDVESITDLSVVDKLVPFPLKPFQKEFVRLYGKMLPAYNLRGYMLDAGAGSGKTVADLVLGECLHAKHVIIVTPKNAIERVWEDTIANIMLQKKTYWMSTDGTAPTTNHHYYICHYESLEKILAFVKANPREFKNKDTFIVLDESHNFNRLAADRTQMFVELCSIKDIGYNLWASGTPILALGIECVPFLKCAVPDFDDECEERFRKIYGKDARRANDILRHRIGHLKFHVPKQDVVDTVVTAEVVKVQMPNAKKYTLQAIGEVMRDFIAERVLYYTKNKKYFDDKYQEGLSVFERTLRTDADRRAYGNYRSAFRTISSGYDPKLMKAEAQLCNTYELKTILPTLTNPLKNDFKGARSVVKYVKLKIMGEALGTIVGGMRSKCHLEMVEHIDFVKYIDGARKKMLIFTSFVEVLERTADIIEKEGYNTARVYGATNKDLSSIVKSFYVDPDVNPLAATFQSLSTAVPLTPASDMILINQPFRDAIRVQTIARAARLGQDGPVFVWDMLLDTSDEPNISTRSNDILQWSQESVASILGITNVDTDTLALESHGRDNEILDLVMNEISLETNGLVRRDFIGQYEQESIKEDLEGNTTYALPPYLYHGSAYKQNELMPGFERSGELVQWDGTEDNTWLYTADDKTEAIMLGISSAIEKKFLLDRYSYDEKRKTLTIEISDPDFSKKDILDLTVWIYTIKADNDDGWMPNWNKQNNMNGEYKTQRHVDQNLVKVEHVDIHQILRNTTIKIVRNEVSTESSTLDKELIRLGCHSTRLRVLAEDKPVLMKPLIEQLNDLYKTTTRETYFATQNERIYDTVCGTDYLASETFKDDQAAIRQFRDDLIDIRKNLTRARSNH